MLNKLTGAEINELAKEARRQYMKEYRQRPGYAERNRKYQRDYWRRKGLKLLEEAEG